MSDGRVTYKVLYKELKDMRLEIGNDLDELKDEIVKRFEKLECDYVTHKEFDPVRRVVYGVVSLILVAVLGALIKLVVTS